jgi:hypothetical protein
MGYFVMVYAASVIIFVEFLLKTDVITRMMAESREDRQMMICHAVVIIIGSLVWPLLLAWAIASISRRHIA